MKYDNNDNFFHTTLITYHILSEWEPILYIDCLTNILKRILKFVDGNFVFLFIKVESC